MLHMKSSGVDVDEALRAMSLLRQRLDQPAPKKINLLTTVSTLPSCQSTAKGENVRVQNRDSLFSMISRQLVSLQYS